MHITCAIMCKNEEKRIIVSLESIKSICKSLVIYDTGSTDNTIDVIRGWCNENNMLLHLKTGEFVDFSTSRNVLLSFCDTFDYIDYILLLDTNDELKTPDELLKLCQEQLNTDNNAFMVRQQWYAGNITTYMNVRLIKPRKDWTYKGVVHEYITCNNDKLIKEPIKVSNIIIYQDRTLDDDKSLKRFTRDKVLLQREFNYNPSDSRTTFYLAQTYECLNDTENAIDYYNIRTTQQGFQEEVFESYLRIGKCMLKLKLDNYLAIPYFLKAYTHSKRAEPLCMLAQIYKSLGDYDTAHMYAKRACELEFPSNSLLFVDKDIYDYQRYHILGIVSYYVSKYTDGIYGCTMALKARPDSEIDKSNMTFYEKVEPEKIDIVEYLSHTIRMKIKENPKLKFEKIVNNSLKLILNKFKHL
jgi:tetratricopeptide (TPR) repeat protein